MFLTQGPRVFAIVLNYRNAGDTLRCVGALRRSRQRAIHPLVVDNASDGESVGRLAHGLGPALPLLASPTNGGYAAGNNIGIRHAMERDADFVWILNPDTEVEPNSLQLLMATMAQRPDVGVVGSLNLFGASSSPTIQSAGGRIDWDAGAVTETIGRGKPATSLKQREPYEVDYVTGASMLVRRRVFDDIGLLPEHYFLYFEETHFQVCAAQQGWRSVVNPLARVWHFQQSGAHLPAPYYTYYYIRGRMLFGKSFTDHDDDALEAGLAAFIDGWRLRVGERAPGYLPQYERLVAQALADGRQGVTGVRAEVTDMKGPVLSHGR